MAKPSLPHMEETSNTSTEEAQSNRTSSGNPVDAAYLPLQQTVSRTQIYNTVTVENMSQYFTSNSISAKVSENLKCHL
ncbi:hypothetical protein DAPPUDRAFT_251249 [Daphnia pulex]|uniref:Uncharacterized protein n=1 Tax=Daphnia pulex TaxID=6669 RepID=E9H010_DAPPU|nr:hypothetical protein DAPPUDRAFT_251249 [Daphnia pulex]|eukprot:EFX74968.1 hypothetical protein DAPPUDRAFT_251249 [Daphnia pulex]